MKLMKFYLIHKKEKCMTNLEQLTHKVSMEQVDLLEDREDIIHIQLLDLMALEIYLEI